MGWDFEEIRELNAAQKGQTRSWLDHLFSIGAASESTLCELADAIEGAGPNSVGALFQLPFPVVLAEKWQLIPTSPDSGRAKVSFRRMTLRLDHFGRFSVIAAGEHQEDPEPGVSTITQGLAVFEVWGQRQTAHRRYLASLEHQDRWDPVVVSQSESWIDNRPITASAYRVNFAKRLRIEVQSMLRNFLPAYSLLSRSEAPVLPTLYGFVPMLAAGRVSDAGVTRPIALHLLTGRPSIPPDPVDSAELERALRIRRREVGRFETQLFAMERLRRDGEVALAIVGVAALLEWFLRSAIDDPKLSRAGLHQLIGAPDLQVLPSELRKTLDSVRLARNRMVHGAPPQRRDLVNRGQHHDVGRELEGDQGMSSTELRRVIEAAFEAFRIVNLQRIEARSKL